jgi:hypothetical protein
MMASLKSILIWAPVSILVGVLISASGGASGWWPGYDYRYGVLIAVAGGALIVAMLVSDQLSRVMEKGTKEQKGALILALLVTLLVIALFGSPLGWLP